MILHVCIFISGRFPQAALNIAKQSMPVPYLPPSTQWATTGGLARVSGCRAFSCALGPPSPYRTPLVHQHDSAVAVLVGCSVSTLVLIVSRLRGQEASASPQNCLLRAHPRVFTPDCIHSRALEGLLLKFFFRARPTRDAPFVFSRHALDVNAAYAQPSTPPCRPSTRCTRRASRRRRFRALTTGNPTGP